MTKLDYTTHVTTIDGDETDLSAYEGKVMLVVNTASKCGFTPQYAGLETLWQKRKDQGLVILGFPCNQFGKQEPGSEDQIQEFCQINYGVSFPMHAKVDVNGSDTHPLFEQLKAAAPGLLGSKAIKWNFTKFLVGADGEILKRYAPKDTPEQIDADLDAVLA
jgi:glutathione peroxidase